MEQRKPDIDFELMARYLSLEANAEEKARFGKWLNADAANRELFHEYRLLWEHLEKVGPVAGLDLDAEWEKLSSGMRPANSRRYVLSRIAVAAVLILAVTFGGITISRHAGYRTHITEDQTREILLPDGSEVTLNAHSSIKYKKRFSSDIRRLNLEGEAFFEVKTTETRPFVIRLDGVEVRVLGTSFNVRAYKELTEIEVTVSKGTVSLAKPGEEPQSVILRPGNKGVFTRSDQSLRISREIDQNYLAWKTMNFIFEDQALDEVVKTLNRVYGSRIVVASDSLKEARITTSFNNQSLEAILNVLSATLDLEVRNVNGQILLTEAI